jgi:hypothetical protein
MTFEEQFAALLDAKLAPLRSEVLTLTAELRRLRRSLPPQLATLKQTAELFGISVSTVKRRAHSGAWPCRRDGGRLLIDLSALNTLNDEEVIRGDHAQKKVPQVVG